MNEKAKSRVIGMLILLLIFAFYGLKPYKRNLTDLFDKNVSKNSQAKIKKISIKLYEDENINIYDTEALSYLENAFKNHSLISSGDGITRKAKFFFDDGSVTEADIFINNKKMLWCCFFR